MPHRSKIIAVGVSALIMTGSLAAMSLTTQEWPTSEPTNPVSQLAFADAAADTAPATATSKPKKDTPQEFSQETIDRLILLARTGLTPDALAVIGATDAESQALVGRCNTYWTDHGHQLKAVDAAFQAAAADIDPDDEVATPAERASGKDKKSAKGRDFQQRKAAKDRLAAAKTARDQVSQVAFDDVTASLPPEKLELLKTYNRNKHWNVPDQYKLVDRTEAQWVSLREALTHVATTKEPSAEATQLIAQADAHARVLAAKVSLNSKETLGNAMLDVIKQTR